MKDDVDNIEFGFGWIILGIIMAGTIFELILLGIAFFGADKAECNMLWCTFTTTRSTGVYDCFENGQRINCSQIQHGWWNE